MNIKVKLDEDDWNLIVDSLEMHAGDEELFGKDRFAGMEDILREIVWEIKRQTGIIMERGD